MKKLLLKIYKKWRCFRVGHVMISGGRHGVYINQVNKPGCFCFRCDKSWHFQE